MKPITFAVFAAVTAAVAGAALYTVANRSAETLPEVAGGAPLVPGLTDQINQVVALTVSGAGASVTITRPTPDSDHWSVDEKAGYPAALDQVRQTILAVAGTRTLEPRTIKPEQYSKLQVDDAGAIRVALRTADGRTLPVLLVGKSAASSSPDHPVLHFYARLAGEAQSWLAVGQLPSLSTDPMQWVERSLPGLPEARVRAVTVSRPGVAPLTISRKDAGQKDFTVEGLPADARPNQVRLNQLATVADFLSFDDVAKRDPAILPDADTVVTTLHAFDGEVLTIRIDRRNGKSWASFTAETEAVPTAAPNAPAPAGQPDPAQEVRNTQERTAAWSYRLPDYSAKELTPGVDDLTEKPPAASEPAKP
jgi:hypothetical protein